jgi:N-acetylneuraminate synthase/N,N'-diacetyllegionaminate synthase
MIKIANKIISEDSPVFIIAEAGVNHNGNLEIAMKLVDAACDAGADAVKFQIFNADKLVIRDAEKAEYQKLTTTSNETQYDMLKKLELSYEDHLKIMEYCKKRNIVYLATPFDYESVDMLDRLNIFAYKIGSGDITNIPFLKYIGEKEKPIILSTGMSNLGEVEEAIEVIKSTGNDNLILLHCTSNYPTEYKDVNLNAMITMKNAFRLPVGYSDHTLGTEVAIAAVSIGAVVIEKHFTLDKNMPGPDHKASLEVRELKQMIKSIRNIEAALGNGIKRCTENEENVKKVVRKSIIAAVDIPSGSIITEEMLTIKRPGTGLHPRFFNYLIGKKAKVPILKDTIVEPSMFE